ncbi:MAG: HAD family hydrolase [Nitrospirales bacterium]|nr:HAD family hydrolase [Nitrospirales bacterium]
MKLLLFDIDGTLLDSGGAGTRALNHAFRELFSLDHAFEGIGMAGKTDLQIIRECLEKHGFPTGNGLLPRMMDMYVVHLRSEIENGSRHLKPGVREALAALNGSSGQCRLGLLTGNIEQGARIKLEPFSLNAYFPSGAFGSDDEDRNRLLPIARRRFEELCGREIPFGDCIVVGDTPRDVHCAKPYGAFSVGVATGPYPPEALQDAGADIVFRDLSDTAAFLEAVGMV